MFIRVDAPRVQFEAERLPQEEEGHRVAEVVAVVGPWRNSPRQVGNLLLVWGDSRILYFSGPKWSAQHLGKTPHVNLGLYERIPRLWKPPPNMAHSWLEPVGKRLSGLVRVSMVDR